MSCPALTKSGTAPLEHHLNPSRIAFAGAIRSPSTMPGNAAFSAGPKSCEIVHHTSARTDDQHDPYVLREEHVHQQEARCPCYT